MFSEFEVGRAPHSKQKLFSFKMCDAQAE